jgi:hypothetical protein
MDRKISNNPISFDESVYYIRCFVSVNHILTNKKLKRRASFGVFGGPEHKYDIHWAPMLAVRTRKVGPIVFCFDIFVHG